MTVRFCVQPGYVRSKSDGDIHYVNFADLCRLYNIRPSEATHVNHMKPGVDARHRNCEDLIHLYARDEGDYFDCEVKYPLPCDTSCGSNYCEAYNVCGLVHPSPRSRKYGR